MRNHASLALLLTACALLTLSARTGLTWQPPTSDFDTYFPPPDSQGGWRIIADLPGGDQQLGIDRPKLDEAFAIAQQSTKNGGLLVIRRGWLVYEGYFGLGHREATCNLASCGKSITSIAVGILLAERPELFPDGLDQKVFTPAFLPAEAFPLSDPRKSQIKLGQLLAMTAGIRGNNPASVRGQPTMLDPAGPDGSSAMIDAVALGIEDRPAGDRMLSAKTLWCEPGEGYSYATSSIHIASIMLRHVTGQELRAYVDSHLAQPLGWQRWGYGYKTAKQVTHTPGGGGIVLRPTDMLRFGYLLLREGRWAGKQLVPADYIRHCRSASIYNPHFPYSLQFDVNTNGEEPTLPRDAFWKSGSGGHILYVVPSLDLVVWKLGGRDAQYSPADTGLPVHPDAPRSAESRSDWKETIGQTVALRQTLAAAVAAVKP
jgi:CubicO group peptidase (beta-lactamase class C family)